MGFICCVPGCKNYNKDAQMHIFPKEQSLYNIWIEKIGRDDLRAKLKDQVRKSYRVCNIHFGPEAQYIGSRYKSKIRADAFPTLYIGAPVSREALFELENEDNRDQQEINSLIVLPSTSHAHAPDIGSLKPQCATPKLTPLRKKICTPAKLSSLRRRGRLLAYTNTRRSVELTPKARRMYKIASDLRKTAKKLNSSCISLKEKVKKMESVAYSKEFLEANLNKPTVNFVMSQLRCQPLKPKGRRYTLDEKILFLSFMKQSPKGYKLLRKLFAIPSRKTLSNFLEKIPFNTGVNVPIMNSLKTKVKSMDKKEKMCSLIFDEMSLDTNLQYSKKMDQIDGFQDNGLDERTSLIADKVMVFMVRGICKKWKQPLAYYFNEGGMKTDVLAARIKEVILACQNIGLNVKTIICDQGTANVAAIKKLYAETHEHFLRRGEENRLFGLHIGDTEVIPLYDPPHLLKGMRNNFFRNPINFQWRKPVKENAHWQHIKLLYEIESLEEDDYKLCKKLTIGHIENTKKMKVSMAAQIFSNNVAAVIKRLATKNELNDGNQMPKEAEGTAEFLLFMDKLFDSVNGSCIRPKQGKDLRCALTSTSPHLKFWTEAIEVLRSAYFYDNKKTFIPPSLKNWVHTLRGFIYLWELLKKEGIKFLCLRNLNQDPLENFFGAIRSHGIRNINPNASSFINHFKSLIVNNFFNAHSNSFNCESDNIEALDNLKHMLTSTEFIRDKEIKFPDISISEYISQNVSLLKKGKLTYVAGFVAKKILNVIRICSHCRQELVGGDRNAREYFLIDARAYSPRALLDPSTKFNKIFHEIIFILSEVLPQIIYIKNITATLNCILGVICKQNTLYCDKHNLFTLICNYVCKFHLNIYVKNINNILKGKEIIKNSKDCIKKYAAEKYKKRQKYLLKIKRQNIVL